MNATGAAADGAVVSARRLRTVFVLNPMSGRLGARAARRERIEAFIREHRLDATLELSLRPGHATEIAQAAVASGAGLVVSVGGDGTMNEVARALVGAPVIYGMIPTGSGNGLGRDLGVPLELGRALAMLLDGRVRPIDSGEVNGYPFFNVMGLGLDAEIGRRFNASAKRGFATYLRIGSRALLEHRKETIEIETEGRAPERLGAFLATVANSTQYGNNARIAPRARLDDGLLDLVAITTSSPLAAAPLGVRMFAGTLDRSRWARTLQAREFRIRRAAPGPVHTDGEIHACAAELTIRVRPLSLRVLAPVQRP